MRNQIKIVFSLGLVIFCLFSSIQIVRADDSNVSNNQGASVNGVPSNQSNDFRRSEKRKNKRIFYLGICSGQVLAKQGIYLTDVESGATTGTADDLRIAIKAALATCKEQERERNADTNASPTPSPSPAATPSATATPISSDSSQ